MNPEPLVCCIMLTRGGQRKEMAQRAVNGFNMQSYENKVLVIYNTGKYPVILLDNGQPYECWGIEAKPAPNFGSLRNASIRAALHDTGAPLIAHWDDDDWSHPERLIEQVALLQESGADAVGYRTMPMYRSTDDTVWMYRWPSDRYGLDTSLMYRRELWEEKPFPETSRGADTAWIFGINRRGRKIIGIDSCAVSMERLTDPVPDAQPRMIAEIHGANTELHIEEKAPKHWRRIDDSDPLAAYVRERMKL